MELFIIHLGDGMIFPRIRDLREDHDWTQAYVAKLLNVTQTCYARYELGQREIPIDFLIRLSDLYGTSIDYLLGKTNNPKRND